MAFEANLSLYIKDAWRNSGPTYSEPVFAGR